MKIPALPAVEWQSFTDRFSRAHAGAIGSLEASICIMRGNQELHVLS